MRVWIWLVLVLTQVWADDFTLSGTPFAKGGLDKGTFSRRIEFVQVTVDDMEIALRYYVDVIGGVKMNFCTPPFENSSACTPRGTIFKGNAHLAAIFGPEKQSNDPDIPNIGDNGDYQVLSNFIAFGNAMIHLIKFENVQTLKPYPLREPLTSPGYVGAGHICIWIEDSVDMNDYIYFSEKEASLRNIPNVAWNRPVPQETRQDRDNVPVSEYANTETEGSFAGLSWSYFKGPVAEQLELYRITGQIKRGIGGEYCDRGAVANAFVNTSAPSGSLPRTLRAGPGDFDLPKRLVGIQQFGYRTNNLMEAAGFYTEVMGGNLIPYPTEGLDIRGDSAHWMIFANETIESYEYSSKLGIPRSQALGRLGVANISAAGYMRLDHRFLLFDNFVVEPIYYTNGLTFGGKPFAPTWPDHSTNPAFIGSIGGAFSKQDDGRTLPAALLSLRERANQKGFPDVVIPKITAKFDGHPYSGLEYAYGKGQSSEILIFVDLSGHFRDVYQTTFEENGFVSTMFPSTDVYKKGWMDQFCQSLSQ